MRAAHFVLVFGLVFGLVTTTFAAMGARAQAPESIWIARLNGANEQPTPHPESRAQGVALFFENADGTLGFRLIVANINNVVFAHIHCGSADVAGPVGVTLVMAMPPGGGRFDGILEQGTLTSPDSGNACGWTDMASVLAAMATGDTYVNVHTNDGMDPANTGPGDFPGGEIRGQIMAVN